MKPPACAYKRQLPCLQACSVYAAAAATLLVLPVLSGSAAAQGCGEAALSMNFDKYSGPLKNYTEAEAQSDFGAGFVFGEGFERAAVGEGALRAEHPKGV
jgi:hypothetical protein